MTRSKLILRSLVLLYIAALVGVPLFFVFQQAFIHGFGAFFSALRDQAMDHAILLTALVAVVAVPLNVIFGVGASLWIVRHPTRFTRVLDTVIDVPLAISPIIVGLVLELVYAQNGWFGSALAKLGWQIMFSFPGIVMASIFVSLPLVSRQVIPLLREIGDHQEQTASTLGAGPLRIFFTITMRSITWATAYGVSLTLARVIGEYGAVLIVSGNIALVTQTLTLDIGANFDNFNNYQGFVGAVLLAMASIVLLLVLGVARHRERKRNEYLA
ncbi:MAG: ABC transporter permease subunit [Acidimicrobiales bacterium]